MKTLLLLRHAKSSWDNPRLADFERPFNGRGRADAPRMGALLHKEGLEPDMIITSSAKRALATATAVAEACDNETAVQATRELYLAGPEEYLSLLAEVPETVSTLLMVGHNPGLEELLEELTGQWERLTYRRAGAYRPACRFMAGDRRAGQRNFAAGVAPQGGRGLSERPAGGCFGVR